MRKLLTVLIMVWASALISQNSTEKFHRAKIYYNNFEDLKQLESLGIPMDHGLHKKNIYFESDFSETEIEKAKSKGYNVEITIEDVKSFYLNQNNPKHDAYLKTAARQNTICSSPPVSYATPMNYDIKPNNDFGGFYTYSEMLQELDDMYAQYPNLISARAEIKDPSDSSTPHKHETAEGRFLQWVKISDNPNSSENEPQILYTAIHHAREPASLQQLIFYMWYLLENYDTDPEIQSIVDSTELFFIPVINPDGYIYNETSSPNGGGLWRKNRRNHGNGNFGVDLNRNYSYITPEGQETWNTAGTSNSTANNTYPGTAPFSEPESKAIRYFIESRDFKIALNNHTYSELLLYPFGYANNQTTEDNEVFVGLSELMVSQNGYSNILSSELYPAAGDSDDFMYGLRTTESGGTREGIFAMTPEIGTSFWPAASSIENLCQTMVFHNLIAAKLAGNYASISDTSPAYSANTATNAQYNLKRLGISEPANFTVSIIAISDNIESVGPENSHDNLSFSQSVNSSISINLNPGIAVGDSYSYNIQVNNGTLNSTENVTKIFGQQTTILEELGNNTASNWTTSDWSTTTEDYVSSSSCITDSPNTNYSNNQNAYITLTNEIDLTAALDANLTFKAKWNIEINYDYVQIEISTNNGNSWIPQCGNYTNQGVPNQNTANGEPLYDGVQAEWVEETIDLSDYLNEFILIRFSLISDPGVTEDGFYFDDLKVNIVQENLNINSAIKSDFNLFPNPVNDLLSIKTTAQDYNVNIFNIHGQLIYETVKNSNDLDIDTSEFPTAVYFMKIRSKYDTHSFRILKQ